LAAAHQRSGRVVAGRRSARPPGYAPAIADDELVRAAQRGDGAAIEALLRQHYDNVYRLCRRITGNDADAADASQEALLSIVRGLPRFDGRSNLATWVYRVTTNACLDELRRRKRRPVTGLPAIETTADASPSADDLLPDRIVVDEALARLPVEFRVPVVLRDLCDLDYAEIAEVLDLPPGTVRSRIARGRTALARQLGGNRSPSHGRPTGEP
jgi:RNA polymerase sigma-70 factor (ECF subfamily)